MLDKINLSLLYYEIYGFNRINSSVKVKIWIFPFLLNIPCEIYKPSKVIFKNGWNDDNNFFLLLLMHKKFRADV